MGLSEWLSLASILLIAIGGLFAYIQWVHANKIRRTEFLNQIIEKIRFDEKLSLMLYSIEYGKFKYDSSFHDGKDEDKMDALMSYLNYVCYLIQEKIIDENEFSILEYELARVCGNKHIERYLWNIYHFSIKNGNGFSFKNLLEYGIAKKIIDESFMSSTSKKYLKYKHLDF